MLGEPEGANEQDLDLLPLDKDLGSSLRDELVPDVIAESVDTGKGVIGT